MGSREERLPGTFHLAQFMGQNQFEAKYLLCCSDLEAVGMTELLNMADPECKELWDTMTFKYSPGDGTPLLKEEIAKLYPGLSSDDVQVINPQEGMYVAMRCLISNWKSSQKACDIHVICTFPAYQGLYELFDSMGCRLDFWTVKKRPGSTQWYFNMDELKAMITDNTKLLVVNFPHNPTGYAPPEEEWNEIIELCKSRGIVLFSDEMYRLSDNGDHPPLSSACTLYKDAITLFGMSKTWGLPGLRVGWLCTQNAAILKQVNSYKDYTSTCPPGPCELLSVIALRNKEKLLNRMRDIVEKNLTVLDQFFRKYPNYFEWDRPKACTTGFLEIKGDLLPSEGAGAFCQKLLKETGILLLPATKYNFDNKYVRVGFGRKNLPEIIEIFQDYLDKK